MAPFVDGSVEGLRRNEVGRLVPTKVTPSCRRFLYILRRPRQLEQLFALQQHEKRKQRKASARWRRSMGCARLFLSHAAEARGQIARSMAMVCGNLVIDYREPCGFMRMPRLTIHMFVLSMDREGHIIWPVDFEPRTKAALRKQARALFSIMLDSPGSYPVDESWRPALTNASDGSLELRPRRRMVPAA